MPAAQDCAAGSNPYNSFRSRSRWAPHQACRADAARSSSPIRSTNPPVLGAAAALPRTVAIHPVGVAIPAICIGSTVERFTGTWWPTQQIRGRLPGCRSDRSRGLARLPAGSPAPQTEQLPVLPWINGPLGGDKAQTGYGS